MPFGIGQSKSEKSANDIDGEQPSFGDKGYYDGFSTSPDAAEAGTTAKKRKVGPRIDKPRTASIALAGRGTYDDPAASSDDEYSIEKQMEAEQGNAIQYRTCSWYKVWLSSEVSIIATELTSWKTAALLFSEYICLAIMSFPYSYSVLGLVPGIILTVVVSALVLYTSLIVWYVASLRPI